MALSREEAEARLKGNMLECMVAAALGSHDLGEWTRVDRKKLAYQARCTRCRKTIYASYLAIYSLLDDVCPGREKASQADDNLLE